MKFYTGNMFPEKYRNQIFVVERGSWNRIPRSGYRVSVATLQGNEVTSYEEFLSGFLQNEQPCARPVDLLIMPDGSILLSEDAVGRIFRITYKQKK